MDIDHLLLVVKLNKSHCGCCKLRTDIVTKLSSDLQYSHSNYYCCFYYEPMTQRVVDRIVTLVGCGCYSPPHILKDSCMIKHIVTLRLHKHFTLHKRASHSFGVYIKCRCHTRRRYIVSGRYSLSSQRDCRTPLKSTTRSICVRLSKARHAGRNTGQLHFNSN